MGGQVRSKLCTHWTEVTHQWALGRMETRPSPTSLTLLAKSITITFYSLFRRKYIVSVIFCISLLRTSCECCGRCCRDGDAATSWAVLLLSGIPVQAVVPLGRGMENLRPGSQGLAVLPRSHSNTDLGTSVTLIWPQISKRKKKFQWIGFNTTAVNQMNCLCAPSNLSSTSMASRDPGNFVTSNSELIKPFWFFFSDRNWPKQTKTLKNINFVYFQGFFCSTIFWISFQNGVSIPRVA